jgi:hypothetical protein
MLNPNFDGIRFGESGAGFIPPDTNGDVGPDHYVQTVNLTALDAHRGSRIMRKNILLAGLALALLGATSGQAFADRRDDDDPEGRRSESVLL